MGGTSFSYSGFDSRQQERADTGQSAFKHDADIKAGKIQAGVHPSLDPYGVRFRESRDSKDHPVTIPIVTSMDLTGSMGGVPRTFQKELGKLMSSFLEAKASGKQYLGEGYPAIMIAGHDDYFALNGARGTVQAGQFESGLEIDDNLANLWFTGNGGGNAHESYDLVLYFLARHTVHDHYEKRGQRGYVFLFGDEGIFDKVSKSQVRDIFGDHIEADIPIKALIKEVQERYHVYYVQPNMTSYWKNNDILDPWRELLGAENVLLLEDPAKVCELIVSVVTMHEANADYNDLIADGVATGLELALMPLSKSTAGAVSKYDAGNLPATTGKKTRVARL